MKFDNPIEWGYFSFVSLYFCIMLGEKMFKTVLDNTPVIKVTSPRAEVSYAIDGSLMNPLEGFYATLAGCAGVYAKKACMSLGVSSEGILIDCQPRAGSAGPLSLGKFKTVVQFPEHISAEHRTVILDSISHCAVKEVVKAGADIEFSVEEKI